MPAPLVLVAAYLAGSIPFAQLAARAVRGVDLRSHGTGTVSGTGLYEVAGTTPLVVGGILDVAKGAVGPVLAGDRPVVLVLAAVLAVVGHDWSVWLRGAGGRGISPAMGAMLVVAWPGTVVLLAGLALGRILGQTGRGAFVAQAALPVVVGVTHGEVAAWAGAAVTAVLWTKRLLGNAAPPQDQRGRVLASRLVDDNDDGLPRRVPFAGGGR